MDPVIGELVLEDSRGERGGLVDQVATIGCVGLLAIIAGTVSYLQHVQAGGAAWAVLVGCHADAAVGGRDDRRDVRDLADGLVSGPAGCALPWVLWARAAHNRGAWLLMKRGAAQVLRPR